MVSYPSIVNTNQQDYFDYPSLLVAIESLFCGIFGLIKGKLTKEPPNPIPNKLSFLLGLIYAIDILAANFALLYISYPIQVIGMNCRYVAAIVVGVFFSRTKHSLNGKKIWVAILATIGAISYNLFKNVHNGLILIGGCP